MTGPTASLSLELAPASSRTIQFADPTSPNWFLTPDTFKVDHPQFRVVATIPTDALKRYAERTRSWLERWVRTGACPFVHPVLYRFRFPACVQAAFTALSTYLDSSEQTKEMVLRIVEDRVTELLASMNENLHSTGVIGVLSDGAVPGSCSEGSSPNAASHQVASFTQLDSFDQIARVHALMVYQSICLYDGDIRARHLAEGRIHILNRWVAQMIDSAGEKLYYPMSSSPRLDLLKQRDDPTNSRTGSGNVNMATSVNALDRVETVWHAWILAESMRRTWLVTTGLQTVYLMLQQTWSPCPGGIMLTTRQGVWDAKSAFAWEKFCLEGDVGFIQRFQTERYFSEKKHSDVDEFCKGAMESAFGTERMERWVG